MSLLRDDLSVRLHRIGETVRRAAPGPILVRLSVFALAYLALLLALPSGLTLGGYGPAVPAVALVPALAPRTWVVTAVILGASVGWVLTSLVAGEETTVPRLLGLAAVLYLLHTVAALAAVLPYDAAVRLVMVVPWLGRALLVVAATAGLSVFALRETLALGDRSYLIASAAGIVVAGGLVWLLARLR